METPETITIQLPSFITRLRRRGREGWQRIGRRLLPTPGNVLFTLLMIGLLLWADTEVLFGRFHFFSPFLSAT